MKNHSPVKRFKFACFMLLFLTTFNYTQAQCNFTAGYTYTLGPNGQVYFTSTSTGTNSNTIFRWNLMCFPNVYGIYSGSALSTFTFAFPNNTSYNVYHVVATTTPSYCADSVAQTIAVTNATCSATTNFTLQQVTNQNYTWNGLVNYPSNVTAVTWYWGDGSTSTGLYPTHTYLQPGYYNICLRVTIACGSVFTACTYSNLNKPAAGNREDQIVTLNIIQGTPTAINELKNATARFNVFPNPNNGCFSFDLSGYKTGSNLNIAIIDLLGNKVYADQIQVQNQEEFKSLNIQSIPNGTYFATIDDGNSHMTVKLFINKE